MKRLIPLYALFFLGCIAALGLPPVGLWPLTLISLALFVRRFQKIRRKRTAFWAGWLFGFGYFLAGLYWIANALLVNIDQYWWAIPFAALGLPALLAIFWGVACVFVIPISQQYTAQRTFLIATALILAETARAYLFTGFPWNQLGLIWEQLSFIRISASLFGLEGLSIITLLLGCCLYHYRNKIALSLCMCSMFGLCVFGFTVKNHSGATNIAVYVVQPNIPQKEKWAADKIPAHLTKLIQMTAEANIDKQATQSVIVWPETAMISNYFNDAGYRQLIDNALHSFPNSILVAGVLSLPNNTQGFANSMYVYTPKNQEVIRYDKFHLVPFGEYIPYQDSLPLSPLIGIEGFEAGSTRKTIRIEKLSFLPLICYEVIFPRYAHTEDVVQALINITNDAWYGRSSGPYQHLAISRFRAIEQGLPLIRAANTGVSAIIASNGDYLKKQALGTESVLMAQLPPPRSLPTLYSRIGRYLPILMIFVLMLGVIVIQFQKRA